MAVKSFLGTRIYGYGIDKVPGEFLFMCVTNMLTCHFLEVGVILVQITTKRAPTDTWHVVRRNITLGNVRWSCDLHTGSS